MHFWCMGVESPLEPPVPSSYPHFSARPLRVSLVALPNGAVSTLYGIYDCLNAFRLMSTFPGMSNVPEPFDVQIVGETAGTFKMASDVPVDVHRSVSDVEETDVVIVPSLVVSPEGWTTGRHGKLVDWFQKVYDGGALLCSACSGIFLLAETGLFDGIDATVHFGYAQEFKKRYPRVSVHPERVLVVSGEREELVSSGASNTWHDLVLYLIARHAGATAAQEVARLYALQWHQDGLAPYIVFQGKDDHGDAEIKAAQHWLSSHFSVANPVEEMIKRSKLATRTFKRRFVIATGITPISYVQRLRIEDAKRRLERTDAPADEVGWRIGYEDPAFFRRLFKRVVGLSPGAYRKRFQIPDFARRSPTSARRGKR